MSTSVKSTAYSSSTQPSAQEGAQAVYFIDAAVPDADVLIEGLGEGAEVVLLQAGSDGIRQIADYLEERTELDAIHIISHGGEGALYLGDTVLNGDNLADYAESLAVIGQSLSETGDILLYGCNIGGSAPGQQFVSDLATLTGADLAASDDLTGSAALGGDWELEVTEGLIEYAVAGTDSALNSYSSVLVAPADEAFDASGPSATGGATAIPVNGWTFTADTGTTIAVAGASEGQNYQLTTDDGAGDRALLVNYDSSAVEDGYGFKSSDGSNFTLDSFQIQNLLPGASLGLTVTIRSGGADIGSGAFNLAANSSASGITYTYNGTDNTYVGADGHYGTFTFDGTYADVDEVRFVFTGAPNIGAFGLDNINISLNPAITSATYNAATGALVVTGTNFLSNGSGADVDASKLTLTGEGGATYTLTNTTDVEITSATQFTVTLSATDLDAVNRMLNKNGTASTSGTTYDVDGAAGFITASAGVADTGVNGVTVSNVAAPAITSASYDYSSGALVVTGTSFLSKTGAPNDIDVSKLTLTGEGGVSYTLSTSADVEITSSTAFSVNLTGADIYNVEALLNKDGTTAASGTTFNLAAAEDWARGADGTVVIADTTGNAITVSNYAAPAITGASYDYSTGELALSGTNFVNAAGTPNDIVANKFTVTGEGGATYTLTDTVNVEITSATSASLSLSTTDALEIAALWNNDGTTSATDGTTYNLAAADDWMAGAPAVNDIADSVTGVTVSNYAAPTVTSATYDYSSNTLVVTGTNFVKNSGAGNDVDVTKLTLTGEGGASYTLTGSGVEIDSATQFTIVLGSADIVKVDALLNQDGTTSATSGTSYNLAAAEDWMAGAPTANVIADSTGNAITVSNYAVPTITNATYDWGTGQLVLTGTNFVSATGANNDIDVTKLSVKGEGGNTYTLTSANVDVTSATEASITLNAVDQLNIHGLLNKDGGSSDDATTYNLAAAEDWMAGAPTGNTIADATAGISVTNVEVPTITSATYDYITNTLVVTGTNLVKSFGGNNDVDVSALTITGEGGSSYALTTSSDVEITSATSFSITLSGADIQHVNALLNNDGTTSATSATSFNLAAADNWLPGSAASTDISDTTGNGITVSNYTAPAVTSATYDWSTGQLVLTGTNFVSASGSNNDIDVTKLSITGTGGNTYTLTSANVDVSTTTSATVTLNATDQLHVHGLLNKDGAAAGDSTTYNLSLAEDWLTGSPVATTVADANNGITASNVATPTITSATYDSSSGSLVVTGSNLFRQAGATNDIDISLLTFTGGNANASYTLTSASDVEITSATSFTISLGGSDKTSVDALLDQIGTSSSAGSTYNLAAADGWLTAADAAVDISDTTGNAINVTIAPQIASATYDASTGTLVVSGSNIQANGGGADIDASMLTLTGEGGETYTLTDTSDVERDSVSQFTLTLSATDKAALNQILNQNGTSSTGGASFNLAAADDWSTQYTSGDSSDGTNTLTVSNVAIPGITSATYDASTGVLTVTGSGFVKRSGADNDIDVSKLTLTGEGGAAYTLTSSSVDITSGTAFSVTLNAADKTALNQILNKNGTSATSGTSYNLAAAEDWAAGAAEGVNVADTTGNGITVSNVPAPTITSATYTTQGTLVVTGANFLKKDGAANDIDVSKLTLTGEGGATYTLTDSADVEITSSTEFTVTLSSTDKSAVNALLNKAGTTSSDSTTYNLSAAEDWAVGADAAVAVADTSGNGITVTIYTPPSSGSSSTTTTDTVDGVTVSTTTDSDGTTTTTIPVVTETRSDDPASNTDDADIPLINGDTNNNGNVVTATLPVGVGLTASGPTTAQTTDEALTTLIQAIDARDSNSETGLVSGAQAFLTSLATTTTLDVRTLIPTTTSTSLSSPIVITGSSSASGSAQSEAFVIDLRTLPSGSSLQLDNIEFASIMGSAVVTGGAGSNYVVGDDESQYIVLGADDDILRGGGGADVIGSLGGDDIAFGDNGDDIIFGGTGNDSLSGGSGNDNLNGGFGYDVAVQTGSLADYQIQVDGNAVVLTSQSGDEDRLLDVERVDFDNGPSLAIAYSEADMAAQHLATTWLGRNLTAAEGAAVRAWDGATAEHVASAFLKLPISESVRDKSITELLSGMDVNPSLLRLDVADHYTGSESDEQGYLPLGLGISIDGAGGHDVIQVAGERSDFHLASGGGAVELTRLSDGAMYSLSNTEMIAFDSGESVVLAATRDDALLARLFTTLLDRDPTLDEWKLGPVALDDYYAGLTTSEAIFAWFHDRTDIDSLEDRAYIQRLYSNTYGRDATEVELSEQLGRLTSGEVDRDWLAVEIAGSDEAIEVIGSVMSLAEL